MRVVVIGLLAVAFLAGCGKGPSSPVLSPSAKSASEVLRNADTFCDEHVGFAGETPPEVIALRTLVEEKEAGPALKQLLDDASPAGKLYALCGLYFCDYVQFQRSIKPFRSSNAKVGTFMGCIRNGASVADIVEVRDPGVVRLTGPDDSLRDWLSKHPSAKEQGFRVDIYGGGWPELLVRGRQSLKTAEPGGAVNRSQPIRPETNRASTAPGSGR